jgi:type IV secretory pathway TrbF-like protein
MASAMVHARTVWNDRLGDSVKTTDSSNNINNYSDDINNDDARTVWNDRLGDSVKTTDSSNNINNYSDDINNDDDGGPGSSGTRHHGGLGPVGYP